MNKGIFKKYKDRYDSYHIGGWIEVRVYYYLSPRFTVHHVPHVPHGGYQYPPSHWAFIDMLVARFAVARVGYNRINIFIYFLFFVIVCLVVGSRNPWGYPTN